LITKQELDSHSSIKTFNRHYLIFKPHYPKYLAANEYTKDKQQIEKSNSLR